MTMAEPFNSSGALIGYDVFCHFVRPQASYRKDLTNQGFLGRIV
jgi:hypothetical protein